ncbi:MAG: hypothetical protein H6867_07990 [Rhodospirillales bacterium]|nr:hypothetical protein [Rhodospirillales bacterium]MCB9995493.1 hypothetical protein [Rhodospirillales bacterium]
MSDITDAIKNNDADAYMNALRTNSAYAALFENGISPDIEAGLRADFAADQGGAAGGFSMNNIGNVLQEVWDALKTGDFGKMIESLVGLFNPAANPALGEQKLQVNAGFSAAHAAGEDVERAYNAAIGINGPG